MRDRRTIISPVAPTNLCQRNFAKKVRMTKVKTIVSPPLLAFRQTITNRRPPPSKPFKRGVGGKKGGRGNGGGTFARDLYGILRIRPTRVQVRVINRDNPGIMQHSLTTLSSIALLPHTTTLLIMSKLVLSLRRPRNGRAQMRRTPLEGNDQLGWLLIIGSCRNCRGGDDFFRMNRGGE